MMPDYFRSLGASQILHLSIARAFGFRCVLHLHDYKLAAGEVHVRHAATTKPHRERCAAEIP